MLGQEITMHPKLAIAYLKAVFGSACRLVVSVVFVVVVNVALNPGLLDPADPYRRKLLDVLDKYGPWWWALATLFVIAALVLPWATFRFTQWRYKGLDATALLPRQRRELSLPVSADDAFALAHRLLLDDVTLFDVQANSASGTISARATPLHSRSRAFGQYRGGALPSPAAALPLSGSEYGRRRPEWLMRVLDGLHLGPPPRRVAIDVAIEGADHSRIGINSWLAALFPSIDMMACSRRHIDTLADAITARVAPLAANRRQEQEKAALQQHLLASRLQVLRAQIEPHFLYNTLANVQFLIRNDPPSADAMVGALIDYLRHALPRMREAVATSTLGDELALARAYLDILRIRMGARLSVHIDAPDALGAHPFPPMLMLSLVENAIKHGLEPKAGGGRLAIDVTADARRLRVAVRDDGIGFGSSLGGGTGIGLRNIRETLASLHGAAATLTVEPAVAGGVVATIEVPRQGAPAVAVPTTASVTGSVRE
jgi:signal transduction histidine kinase